MLYISTPPEHRAELEKTLEKQHPNIWARVKDDLMENADTPVSAVGEEQVPEVVKQHLDRPSSWQYLAERQ